MLELLLQVDEQELIQATESAMQIENTELRLFPDGESVRIEGTSARRLESGDNRILHPVVYDSDTLSTDPDESTDCTLRAAFEAFHARSDQHGDRNWADHRTLIRRWESVWDGPGPSIDRLTAADVRSFFERVPGWHQQRTWEKYRGHLYQILRASCPASYDNMDGWIESEGAAPLTMNRLPAFRLPSDRWFNKRKRTQPQRAGGRTNRQMPVITTEECGRLLDAMGDAQWMRPELWRCWFSHVWINGPRPTHSLTYTWDTGSSCFDFDLKVLHFQEDKKLNQSHMWMPSWLESAALALRTKQGGERSGEPCYTFDAGAKRFNGTPDFIIPRGDVSNTNRRFRKEYRRFFEVAEVAFRDLHDLHQNAVNLWIDHAPMYRFAAIGHQTPKTDVQLRNYHVPLNDTYRKAVETFPFPDSYRTD